jgi:predicted ArsR family transcriptional regulator
MRDRWKILTALVDQSRRALYDYVRRQDHPVTREEAARAGRLSRGLAAFHLDKLVAAGLLRARYQSPPGVIRGRGRTPKVYEPMVDGLTITFPERRYELIAEILADAVAAEPAVVRDVAICKAHERGATLGTQLRNGPAPGTDTTDPMPVDAAAVDTVLGGLGFEPESSDGRTLLHNCPFHALAARQTALVCALNLAFIGGLIEGLGAKDVEARLVPRPPACCVELTTERDRTALPDNV